MENESKRIGIIIGSGGHVKREHEKLMKLLEGYNDQKIEIIAIDSDGGNIGSNNNVFYERNGLFKIERRIHYTAKNKIRK